MGSSRELSLLERTGMGTFSSIYVLYDYDLLAFKASETDVEIIDFFDN